MVAVTQHLEEKQKHAPDVEGDLSKAHTGLMRQLWTRATIIESLKDCTYKLIEQNGRVAIEIVPPVSKEVTPWHHMGSQGRVFKLFSTNSKMKCVAGGTPVLTDRGVLPIEHVRVGDKVLTREGYRPVRAAQQTGVRETLHIVTATGQEVRVTPDHLILAKVAWPLGECPSPSLRGELEWTRADCLNTEMFVCPAPEGFDAGLPRQASDRELGVLLGYVCGDGSFAENGRVVVDVGEQKRDNLQILADIASRRFGASPHWGEYSGHRSAKGIVGGSGKDPEEYESCFRLYWETPALTAFFAEHGFRHKVYSPMREVPQSILHGSRDFMLGFLGGYLSSDGSVHTTSEGRVMAEISTTSRLLALGVQQLFAVLGARVSVNRTEHWQGEKQFRDLYRITITSAAALNVLREAEPINVHKRERLGEPQKLGPKTRLVRIETIEHDRLCLPVYDLTVDGPPEFVAGGMVVHNCPTFDLPSGVTQVGGSCPAALFGQTTALGQKLVEMTGDIFTAERGFSNLLDERQVEWEAMRAYQEAHGLPEAPPFKRSLKLQNAVCNSCVAGDTLVMVRNKGLRRIEELVDEPGFEVWSGLGWRETRAVLTKVGETVEVVFNGGRSIRCTPDHRIMTTDGEVEAGHLIAGEHQVMPQMPEQPPFPKESLLPVMPETPAHFNEKRGVLPTSWSKNLGVWLGYILGNGWFTEAEKYPTIGLCGCEEDADDLRRLAELVAPIHGGVAEVAVEAIDTVCAFTGKRYESKIARAYWRRKTTVNFLKSLGLSKLSELQVPAELWRASEDAVTGFLSGLFSTDGSVARWPNRVAVSFSNTSKRLCLEVQQLLLCFGVRSNICEYTPNAARGYKPLWKVDISAHDSVVQFQRRIGFFCERKARSLQEGIGTCSSKKPCTKPLTVLEVRPGRASEPVYDLLNVGEEQQFLANGIPVHNCYASSGKYGETSTQLGELVRFGWVQSLIKSNPEQLVETLFRTINETQLEGESKERFPYRFIRVHSSGDFFSSTYAKVWLDVARLLEQAEQEAKARGDTSRPPVRLWAPTRSNFLPGMLSFWKRESATMPGNFAVRFSSYAIGDPAPYIHRPSPTKCKGTSVLSEAETKVLRKAPGEKFDWQCGVYDLGKGDKTCLAAKAPDGKVGCRACWLHPEFAVNYAQH